MLAADAQTCPECLPAASAAGGFWARLLDTSDFPARWRCGTWDASLGWLHIGSDLATWFAYLCIPVMLAVLVRRRRGELPAPFLFTLFTAFILACGTGHLMEAVIFWWPAYRVAGLLKLMTAVVSVATVVALFRTLPRLFELKSPVALEREVLRRTAEVRRSNAEREEALRAAEAADHAKSRFLATMSHELRTPVAAILGNVELLLTDPHMDEEARRARLEAIQSNAEHQVALISDVLELSKIEANSMELDRQPTRLGRVAREALALVEIKAREKGIELRLEGEDALPALATDALRVRQILVNLLANAIRFTDEGGVTVELAGDVDHGVVRARVTVRDTGRGMTTEQLGRIFDAYRQAEVSMERNRGGTGLGLAISRELAARLGGDLVATSEPGAGSAFVLTLAGPLASEVPPPLPQASMEDLGAAIAGTRILLAEDQRDLALVVRRQLELAGCTVVHAADGHAAVEAFAEQEPDLVLLDLQMPRMGGLEAARRIRAGGWTGPIVALTANAALEEREACLRDAFDDFATKPLRRRSLLEVVERNVRGAERA